MNNKRNNGYNNERGKAYIKRLEIGYVNPDNDPLTLRVKYDLDMAWSIWFSACKGLTGYQIGDRPWFFQFNVNTNDDNEFLRNARGSNGKPLPPIVSSIPGREYLRITRMELSPGAMRKRNDGSVEYMKDYLWEPKVVDKRDSIAEIAKDERKIQRDYKNFLLDDDDLKEAMEEINMRKRMFAAQFNSDEELRQALEQASAMRREQRNPCCNPELAIDACQTCATIALNPAVMGCYDTIRNINEVFRAVKGDFKLPSYLDDKDSFIAVVEQVFNDMTAEEQALTVLRFIQNSFSAWDAQGRATMGRIDNPSASIDYYELMQSYGVFDYGDTDGDESLDDNDNDVLDNVKYKNVKGEPSLHEYIVCWFDMATQDAKRIGKSDKWIAGALRLRQFIVDKAYVEIDWKACANDIRKNSGLRNTTANEILDWYRNAIRCHLVESGYKNRWYVVANVRGKKECKEPFFKTPVDKHMMTAEQLKFVAYRALTNIKVDVDTELVRKDVYDCIKQAHDSFVAYIDGGDKELSAWRIIHDVYNNTPWDKRQAYSELESNCRQAYDLYAEELQDEFECEYELRFKCKSPLTILEYARQFRGNPECKQDYEPTHKNGSVKYSDPNNQGIWQSWESVDGKFNQDTEVYTFNVTPVEALGERDCGRKVVKYVPDDKRKERLDCEYAVYQVNKIRFAQWVRLDHQCYVPTENEQWAFNLVDHCQWNKVEEIVNALNAKACKSTLVRKAFGGR